MVFARLNFSVNENVCIERLHWLSPVHEIEQGVPVKQVNPGQFRSFPPPQAQPVGPLGTGMQGATKKVIGDRLESAAFFGGLPLQFTKKLVVDRQSCSCHAQKHIGCASRCQRAVASGEGCKDVKKGESKLETRNSKCENRKRKPRRSGRVSSFEFRVSVFDDPMIQWPDDPIKG